MPGSHYTLDREKRAAELAAVPKTKACRDCKVVKPNDFNHFGKKLSGSRTTYATVDVCHQCKGRKVSETRSANTKAALEAKAGYEAESLRRLKVLKP